MGDIAFAWNEAAGRRLRVEHWGDAEAMAEVAAKTLAGMPAAWRSVPGFWSAIGDRTLKLAAWGDGWDDVAVRQDDEGFTAWYGRDGATVGVLTHNHDADLERGTRLVESGAPVPAMTAIERRTVAPSSGGRRSMGHTGGRVAAAARIAADHAMATSAECGQS